MDSKDESTENLGALHGSTEHLLEFSSSSSSAIPGLNDKQEWNAWVNDLQESLDFQALVEFLEGLKE